MGKSIKGTKTEKNLVAAFAGESMDSNRYMWFAHAARSSAIKPGYEQILKIFTDTAENEKIHARMFFKYIEWGDVEITASYPAGIVKDTKTNLEAAADREKFEWTTLYQNFAKTAREEGFPEVATSFEQIAKAEKFNESRFRKLAENIANGRVFKRAAPVEWHCINCAYVFEGTEAPAICPACKHPYSYYELLGENY